MIVTIRRLGALDIVREITRLADLLHASVEAGASINFVLPFSQDDAAWFWLDQVLPTVREGSRTLLVAEVEGTIAGSVQLALAPQPNQPHRSEITKLMTHPAFRRRGIARNLMAEIEAISAGMGRTLITLDTRTGDDAEPLYTAISYTTVGVIPDFCIGTIEPTLHGTTIMYKQVKSARPSR